MSVTPRAIQGVYSSTTDASLKPIVQVLSVSSLAGQVGRFKIILSDGETYTTGLLASHFIQSLGGTCPFQQFQLVRLDSYQVNSVQDKHFLLIHGLSEVSPPLATGQIGHPVAYKSPAGAQQPPIQQAPTPQPPPQPQQFVPPQAAQQSNAPQHQPFIPVQSNPYAYPQLHTNNPYAASSNISNASANNFVNPYQQPQQPVAARQPAPLTRHPSMPSHTPFAAGMNQSLPQQQLPYANQTTGPVRYMQSTEMITPMSQLTIYTQKWTIKARVSGKSEMRTFRNAKGEGQLMNVELVDSEQTEMRATFFGSAAQKFYPILQIGKVFTFSKGSVKPANPKFNPRAQYELMFDDHSDIIEVSDDSRIPAMKIDINPIAKIADAAVGSNVDIAGIVLHVGEVGLVTIKSTGKETPRRTITIADESNASIDLTIWGERCERLGDEMRNSQNPVVFVKGCRVGDFNGRSLSTSASSQIEIDPDHPKSFELKAWWMRIASSTGSIIPLSVSGGGASGMGSGANSGPSDRTWIQAMRSEDVATLVPSTGFSAMQSGTGRTVNSHLVKATIVHIPVRDSSALYYKSCATEIDDGRGGRRLCQKKAELQGGGDVYVCAEQHMNRTANARFIVSMRIQDSSGECLVRAFHDQGKAVLGVDATEIDNSHDPLAAQQEAVDRALFRPFMFKIRSKKEVHMDEERINMVVADVQPVNPNSDAKYMLNNIRQFLNKQNQ